MSVQAVDDLVATATDNIAKAADWLKGMTPTPAPEGKVSEVSPVQPARAAPLPPPVP